MTHRTMITNGKELKYKQVLILDDKNNVALQKKFDRDKGILREYKKKGYICEECDGVFIHPNSLQNHQCWTKDFKYNGKCDKCGKNFEKKINKLKNNTFLCF